MASAAENALHSPQGGDTVKERVPILKGVIDVNSYEPSGILDYK